MADPTDLSAVLMAGENVKSMILSSLCSGDDGPSCLLGIRKVSRGLRDWIDTAVVPRGREGMPNTVAVFRQEGPPAFTLAERQRILFEKLQSLLEFPPPVGVRSLAFQAEFPLERTNGNQAEIWTDFLHMWDSRLLWMTVDMLAFPLTEEEELLFGSMKTIKIMSLVYNPPPPPHGRRMKIPSIFYSAASVSIRMLVIPEEALTVLFSALIENQNLRDLTLGIGMRREARSLLNLIKHKRADAGFRLGVYFTLELQEKDPLGKRLVAEMIASTCQIRLISVSQAGIRWMLDGLSIQQRLRVCAKVESVGCWLRLEMTPLSHFPSLAVILGLDFKDLRLVEELPSSLRALEVKVTKTSAISLTALPDGLLQLNVTVDEAILQLNNLAVYMSVVAERCPRLESIGVYVKSLENVSKKPFRPPGCITSLKHVEFLASPSSAVTRKSNFTEILQVPGLRNLETLSFYAFEQTDVELQTEIEVETSWVTDIMAGAAGRSLVRVQIKSGRLNGADRQATFAVYTPLVQLADFNRRRQDSTKIKKFVHSHFAAYCPEFTHPLRTPTGFY